MSVVIIVLFIVGYIAIALEHPLRLNKAAAALVTGVLCWTLLTVSSSDTHRTSEALLHHLGEIASILFFLLGAMTIVELIDSHGGFDIITEKITTTSKRKLLITIAIITFLLSALLDNLTTAIVMASLCTKILSSQEDRRWFCGIIVIAANAGGAWSPLGDVTTTMLWIGGQITALQVMKQLIVPAIFVCAIPVAIVSFKFRGQHIQKIHREMQTPGQRKEGMQVLAAGILFLVFVPVFKTLTHMPPFMGMLLALGLMWIFTTILHLNKKPDEAERLTVARALQKIDSPSILFFLGILLAVAALQTGGMLSDMAGLLNRTLRNDFAIGSTLGLLSALVDNVPLVAASQGMYDLSVYPTDHPFWEFLALTTGTGGSAIIIGSAAGVAIMGIEKIDFIWYLKKISWLALIGFAAGILVFLLQVKLLA